MIEFMSEAAGWSGFVLLIIAIGIPVGALIVLPFSFVLEDAADAVRAGSGWTPPTFMGEALITAFCLAWLIFAAIAVPAFANAVFVPFSEVGLRYF